MPAVHEPQVFKVRYAGFHAGRFHEVAPALGVVDLVGRAGGDDGDAGGVSPGAQFGGPGAPVSDPPHDDAFIADAFDERDDFFFARAHLHADDVRGVPDQPDDRVHVVRGAHIQQEARAAVPAELLSEGHVVLVGRFVIGHAGQGHDEVHVRWTGKGRLPAYEFLRL